MSKGGVRAGFGLGTAGLVLVGGTLLGTAFAHDDSESEGVPESSSGSELSTVADRIKTLGGEGFAGVEVRQDQVIVSHWVGAAPGRVKAYAESRPMGVTIVLVERARFNREQLQASQARIADCDLAIEVGAVGVSVLADGSGLRIDLRGALPERAQRERLAELAGLPGDALWFRPEVGGIDIAPVPVHVNVDE